jgi:hypothetical protein
MKVYWVLIPPWVMADHDLSDGDKILCGVINGLIRERGYCYASNEYLAKYSGKADRTISRTLAILEERGHIAITKKHSKYRQISIAPQPDLALYIAKNGEVTSPKVAGYSKRDEKRDKDIQEIFDFWITERKERLRLRGPTPKLSDSRRSKINARLDDGYSVADIKEAILGMLSNDFNVRGGFTDIELACRNAQKIDQYRMWHKEGHPQTNERKPRWDDEPPAPEEWI